MINRKKKLIYIQSALFFIGLIIIIYSYSKISDTDKKIFDLDKKEEINKTFSKTDDDSDIFFNIKYSGLDLSGNRYILESEEAIINKSNQKLVKMNKVKANFYFKDDTVLKVWSDTGNYNNETLDMTFKKNVKAEYIQSKLFAEKAEYSNSQGYLIISDEVKVVDPMGNLKADRLTFDVKNQKLNIDSFNDDKINANINLK
tara:strand:+ start:1637 stop:2239 length:603 start_codon:yes stop_codon:yes gene_type:complete